VYLASFTISGCGRLARFDEKRKLVFVDVNVAWIAKALVAVGAVDSGNAGKRVLFPPS
jgi:hypothetical protein